MTLASASQAQTPQPFDWTYTFGVYVNGFDLGDSAHSLAVDSNGDVVAAGSVGNIHSELFSTADFDPTTNEDDRLVAGFRDVAIVKLTAAGDLVWAQTLGGSGDDATFGVIALDDASLLVAGHFTGSVDFDPGIGTFQLDSAGDTDIFLSRFEPNGSHQWTKTFGGEGTDMASGLVAHPSGGVVIFGSFSGTVDFDPSASSTEYKISNGLTDVYALHLTEAGAFNSVITLGGLYDDFATGIAVNPEGDIFIAGAFSFSVDFDPGVSEVMRTAVGHQDAFLCHFDSNWSFDWVWSIGSPNQDVATDVKLTAIGDPVVIGFFGSSASPIDFDPTNGVDAHQTTESQDVFVTRLGRNQTYAWTRTTQTSRYAFANTLAIAEDLVLVTGAGAGVIDFSPQEAVANELLMLRQEAYVWALTHFGDFGWVFSIPDSSASGHSSPHALELDSYGNLYWSGHFSGDADFDPSDDVSSFASRFGGLDGFVAKYRGFLPYSDHDGNDRVDLRDFGAFQSCFEKALPESECRHFDFNENRRLDIHDYAKLAADLNGP